MQQSKVGFGRYFFSFFSIIILNTSLALAGGIPNASDGEAPKGDPGAQRGDGVPMCPAYGRDLPVNNQQVLHWKRTTKNQFQERAHVKGTIDQVFPDKNGHEHFEIQIGNRPEDVLEVIYNQDFGSVPPVKVGMIVEACGDYITSTAPSGPYPASPSGAIIHWVHRNPKGRGHDDGFMMIDGTLYGTDTENAGPKNPPAPKQKDPRRKHGGLEFAPEYDEAS